MKASCVLRATPIPTSVPLLAAAVHPPSSFDHKLLVSLRSLQSFGSCGSALSVVPFNKTSKQDVEALVDYIYANLGMDLDSSYLSLVSPKTVEKLMGWTTNLNSPTG
jgi:3-oxoacyl-ACP reductase-like protein